MKSRNEIEEQWKWNFADIFPDDGAWESAYAEAVKAVEEIAPLEGTFATSPESMKAGLEKLFAVQKKAEKVYLYAMLRKNVDNGDATYQTMFGKATNLVVSLSAACSFLEPEILSMDEETVKDYQNRPEMKLYRHLLESINRGREHILGAEQEQMLALLSDAAGGTQDAFQMLESVDMTFPDIHGEDGKEVKLTHGSFGIYRNSSNRDVRKEAFEVYFGEFGKYIHTFAALYGGSVKMDNYYAKVRKYESCCHQAMFADNAPIAVYESLIESVREGLPILKRYSELRKKVLGLDELHIYDLYCPMVKDADVGMTYENAKRLVKEATKPLGEEYGKLLDRAFSERWIDVYENPGKTTGAYSCGVYGVHPYVLLNFSGKLDDAFTLAHELGHSMHSYFSDAAQDFVNHNYKIMVAEVASTVNEVLLTKYLLSVEQDKDNRAAILNHFLEGFRTTVFRQTLFAEFEKKAHDLEQEGTPLTADLLNDIYRKLNEEYYEGVVIDDLQKIEWARIPHFYNAFYVYQYATGFSAAVAIADRILNHNGAADYLRFLSTGGSMDPLEELKITGIDLTKKETVQNAMKVFSESLDELESLLTEK